MRLDNLPARMLKAAIAVYAYAVSPLLGSHCRFHPTCSCYAREAMDRHGALRGSWLTFRRLMRCHPWYKGPMLDPVPEAHDAGCRKH